MKVLWLTWKDRQDPRAGGAEVVNHELARRLAMDGHEVIFVVADFGRSKRDLTERPSAVAHDASYKVIRLGNRWTVYWQAFRYYRRHLRGWADVVIDEVNTMPFFAKLYVNEPNVIFVHMLCRKIWFHELPKPLGIIGYLLEPLYLRLLSSRQVIAVSESTRRDLLRAGFTGERIQIISEGIELTPVDDLTATSKYSRPTLLSLGSMRSMKRTLDQIRAFEIVKQSIPSLQLVVAGNNSGRYARKVLNAIQASPNSPDIHYRGQVSREDKLDLMQRCHALVVTSVKEGWGLTVTEAASQGTPAVVYDVDGLRDSVRHGQTGLVVNPRTPAALAASIIDILQDPAMYTRLRRNGWEWSKSITFDQSYADFRQALTPYLGPTRSA